MGERHDGDGPDRRRARPGGTVLGPAAAGRDPGFEARLGAALREAGHPDGIDPEAEQGAVAAFRVARDAGAHAARPRRRDDWRPRPSRGAGPSLKTTLSVFLASITLGGVAVAAIGSAGSEGHDDAGGRRRAHPSASTAEQPAAGPGAGTSKAPSVRPNHPATAKDTLAHCRLYVRTEGRGRAWEATSRQRLVTAAGGEEHIAAYCAEQIARADDANRNKDNKWRSSGNSSNNGNGAISDKAGEKAADSEKADGKK
ncbi:hypothetical protein ACIRU3_00945 [Streptomyces sp. NPDC101151]|uniref:hypothetical protein n=1 Tax=Streptomyces sp. NPDC101151 TaxID=3366115 RepID=UPI003805DFB5